MRIALLSNVTVDLLAGILKKTNDVYLAAGFDTWQQELILPTSGLYEFKPEAVVVLLHADAYGWENDGHELLDEWCGAFLSFLDSLPGVPLFISSIDVMSRCYYGAEKRMEEEIENYLIVQVQKLHQKGSIYILPVKDAITDLGRKNFYSSKMWYVGSMPYSMKGLSALSDLIKNYTSVTKARKKKCLVVDLDNTLWGGVIGEDGVDGIVLSNHKEGARYYDTQKLLKKMKDQGVMLAVISKNNVEDVEPVFEHPHMILKHEDFVAEFINWETKSKNIHDLARMLNIGLDSFVFLDDNPAEREEMKAECPEVTILDFPKDTSLLPDVVEKAYNEFFLSLDVTGEDAGKTAMYRAEGLRKAELSSSASVEEYLKKLEMTMTIHRMLPEEEKRVVQLVNKTNQFNVTTKRYGEDEIRGLAEQGDVITVHMSDKYGDQGLVAILILKCEGNIAEIDTFLMSCRVMGRQAENEILAQIRNMLEKKGINTVRGIYIRTAKNAPVENLFERMGFTVFREHEGVKEYTSTIEALPESTGVFMSVVEDLN